MPDYASQISPQDRWNIIAYVRALQLSQNATHEPTFPPDRRFLLSRRSSASPDRAQPCQRSRRKRNLKMKEESK